MHAVGGSTLFNLQTFAATGTQAASRLTAGTSTWATYRYSPVHSSGGLVAKLSFSPLSLKLSRCPCRELSGRLVDAKLPLSSGRNRWLLRHFFYLLIVSDTTRVRLDCVCTIPLAVINTFCMHFIWFFFFFLSVLQLRCHKDSQQQVLAFRSH